MSRPKANTLAGAIATERWRATMEKKYGNITNKMKEIGRIGGQNGKGPDYKGGFAGNRERARLAGAKGGKISRRKGKYTHIMDENKEAIKIAVDNGMVLQTFADDLGVPYKSLLWYIKTRFGEKKDV